MTSETMYNCRLTNAGSSQIRILELQPGKGSDPLTSRLRYVSLDSNPQYFAISYRWSTDGRTTQLGCSGSPMPISRSLAAAMRRFRKPKDALPLWTDAVCINQSDEHEKGVQLSLMRRIYEQACKVKIWLGEDEGGDAETAFALVRGLARAKAALGDAADHITCGSPHFAAYGLPPITSPAWRSFVKLLEQDWFYRVWIIQEVVVAKKATMYWGASKVGWRECSAAMDLAITNGTTRVLADYASPGFSLMRASLVVAQLVMTQHRFLKKGPGSLDLAFLLLNHRAAQATKPRDKVFALLGLSLTVEGRPSRLPLDYAVDSTAAVYIKTAKRILELSESLDLLSVSRAQKGAPLPSARERPQPVAGLPSWVPDWSLSAAGGEICFRLPDGRYHWTFNAAQNSQVVKAVQFSRHTLVLQGHAFDEITSVGELMQSDEIDPAAGSASTQNRIMADLEAKNVVWAKWRALACDGRNDAYPTGECASDAFVRTLFLGQLPPGETLQTAREFVMGAASEEMDDDEDPFGKLVDVFSTLIFDTPPRRRIVQKPPRNTQVLADCRTTCTDMRRMVRTKKGYIGLAAPGVARGDRLMLVKGGRVPLILRATTRGETWTLVGDCYIHGIMQGEAFRQSRCTAVVVE